MIIDGVTNCSVGGWLREFCFLCTTFGIKELLLEAVFFLKDLFLYFQLYIVFCKNKCLGGLTSVSISGSKKKMGQL